MGGGASAVCESGGLRRPYRVVLRRNQPIPGALDAREPGCRRALQHSRARLSHPNGQYPASLARPCRTRNSISSPSTQATTSTRSSSKSRPETISKVLYPNDETLQGKELRLRQQYFFVACSIQEHLPFPPVRGSICAISPSVMSFNSMTPIRLLR